MREEIGLGPVPANESPVQLPKGDWMDAHRECRRHVKQLYRQFGDLAKDLGVPLDISIISERGRYLDVVVYYETSNSAQLILAYYIDEVCLTNWNDNPTPATREDFDKWVGHSL